MSAYFLASILSWLWKSQLLHISHLQEELTEAITVRDAERTGRINVQRQLREAKQSTEEVVGYNYKAIGFIESPFPERRGTPRQPSLVTAARGKIRFNKHIIQLEHFKELACFSHVWVLFVFHNNTNTVGGSGNNNGNQGNACVAKVKPPRLHGQKVGCLTTRSPHRPNNIGLSVCEITGIGPDYIEISGLDMVDGTPVLDVKPYIPYDIVPSNIELPMLRWADDAMSSTEIEVRRNLSVPKWIYEADVPLRAVTIPFKVEECLYEMEREKLLKHSFSADRALLLIKQVLQQDIRGFHQGRAREPSGTNRPDDQLYECNLDGMHILFTTTDTAVTVVEVKPVESAKRKSRE